MTSLQFVVMATWMAMIKYVQYSYFRLVYYYFFGFFFVEA